MAGAVAAVTSRVKVGTWVLSALHRNPGIIAKTAETLDEISGGRFVFGLGAGHEWPGQAHAFGLPEDQIFARFEEALQIIVPLLRSGHADFEGTWHAARDLVAAARGAAPEPDPAADRRQRAEGPAPRRPTCRHLERLRRGARRTSTRSAHGSRRSTRSVRRSDAIRPRSGRVAGVSVNPLQPAGYRPDVISGSADEIADALRSFRDAGFTQVDIMLRPGTIEAFDALAPVVEQLDAD